MTLTTEQGRLDILHDHYKESFSHIREREKYRDRLFLVLIGLFALLIFEVGYPIQFGGSLDSVSVAVGQFDLRAIPLPPLLSATWVFTFAVVLRYCQVSINVERSYDYLHSLETTISPLLGGNGIYRREGSHYQDDYPPLLQVAWIAYAFVFPLILLIATVALLSGEWINLSNGPIYKLFDSAVAFALCVFMYLYRTHPLMKRLRAWARQRRHDSTHS